MKFAPIAIAAAAFVSLHTLSEAATFQSVSGTGFTTETASLANSYLAPVAPAGSSVTSYSVLSTATGFSNTGTISFAAPVTAFTFLWGSPDSFNRLTDGTVTVTGSSFSSGKGNNAESTLYTFVDALGFTALTFSTTGIAFEIAAAPVPEPQMFALLLAGLGAVGFMALRRGALEAGRTS
jgi:PEP-CTERM motif